MLKGQPWGPVSMWNLVYLGVRLIDWKLLSHYRLEWVSPECTHCDSHSQCLTIWLYLEIKMSHTLKYVSVLFTICTRGIPYISFWKLIHWTVWTLGENDKVDYMRGRIGGFGQEFRLWHCTCFTESYLKLFLLPWSFCKVKFMFSLSVIPKAPLLESYFDYASRLGCRHSDVHGSTQEINAYLSALPPRDIPLVTKKTHGQLKEAWFWNVYRYLNRELS